MNSINEVGNRGMILQDRHTPDDLVVGSENGSGHSCYKMGGLIFILDLDDRLVGRKVPGNFKGTFGQTGNPHKYLSAAFPDRFGVFLPNQRLGAEIHG